MIEKHYKSDFKVFVSLPDRLTLAPFKFTYFIEGNRTKYVVSYDGHSYYNCSPLEDGRLLIIFQNHNLGIGTINVIRQYFLPDEDFASGVCRTFSEGSTDIYLGEGYSDEGDIHVQLPPNYMQGKPGKSAYQEWLDMGNSGSVQNFLDSLKGDQGERGEQGIQGEKGEKGDKMTYNDLTEEEKDDLASRMEVEVDLSEYAKKSDVQSAIEEIVHKVVNQTDSVATIQPNVLNVWGEVASLDITLAEPTDNTIVNEYMVQFTSGVTATTLILPNTIKWMATPNIQPNKTYQLSIINNLGVIGEFSNE